MNIKIYFNGSCLEIIDIQSQYSQNEDVNGKQVSIHTHKEKTEILEKLLKSKKSKNFSLLCNNAEITLEEIKSRFVYIEAAGGFIRKEKEFLFIKRLGVWDLPKGKLEVGESTEHCAVRECEEECGVNDLKIIAPLSPTYHLYPYKGAFALKKSYWYLMNTSFNLALKPQLEENITEVKWLNKKQIFDQVIPLTYLTIRDVIREGLTL